MNQFFAASLGAPSRRIDNIFLDWGHLVDRGAMKPEPAWSAPEAYLCILMAAAACDNEVSFSEQDLIKLLAHRSRGLKSLADAQLAKLQAVIAERLTAGSDLALQAACSALPAELRLPTFAQALDIVLANADLSEVEARFLDALAQRLDLDPDDVRRIAEVILLKNRC